MILGFKSFTVSLVGGREVQGRDGRKGEDGSDVYAPRTRPSALRLLFTLQYRVLPSAVLFEGPCISVRRVITVSLNTQVPVVNERRAAPIPRSASRVLDCAGIDSGPDTGIGSQIGLGPDAIPKHFYVIALSMQAFRRGIIQDSGARDLAT